MSFTVTTTPPHTPEAQTLPPLGGGGSIDHSSSTNNINNGSNFNLNSNNNSDYINNSNNNNNNNGVVPHHYGVQGANPNAHPMQGQMALPNYNQLSPDAVQLLQKLRQFRADVNASIDLQLKQVAETKAQATQRLSTMKQNVLQRMHHHQHLQQQQQLLEQEQQRQDGQDENGNNNQQMNDLPVWSKPSSNNNNGNTEGVGSPLIVTPPNTPALGPTASTIDSPGAQTTATDASETSLSNMLGSPNQKGTIGLGELLMGVLGPNNNHGNNQNQEGGSNNLDGSTTSASSSSAIGSNAEGKGYNLFSPAPPNRPRFGDDEDQQQQKPSEKTTTAGSSPTHSSQQNSPTHEEIINRLLRENSPEEVANFENEIGKNRYIHRRSDDNNNQHEDGGDDDNNNNAEGEDIYDEEEVEVETDVTVSASDASGSDADNAASGGAEEGGKKKKTVRKLVKRKKLVLKKVSNNNNETAKSMNPITSSSADALRLLQETRIKDEQQKTSSSSSPEVADDSLRTLSVERLVKLYGHKTAEHRIIVGYQEGRPVTKINPGTQPDTPKSLADIDIDPTRLPCQTIVQFKNHRLLQVPFPMFVAPGDHVFVDIDRGRDLGVVIFTATSTLSQNGGKQLLAGLKNARLGKIVGLSTAATKGIGPASESEAAAWRALGELENRAVRIATQLAKEHLVPLNFVDAEYQYDKSKLTVYYPRETPKTDFRELVRFMYKTFKARIWLEPMGENMSLLK